MALIDTTEKIFQAKIRQDGSIQFNDIDTLAAASSSITSPDIFIPSPISILPPSVSVVGKINEPEIIAKKEEYNIIDRLNDLTNRVSALETKKSFFQWLLTYLGVKGNA